MIRTAAALFLLLALGALVDAAPADPSTVSVTMIDYKFEPDHLVFQHGVHYRLHLENHGRDTHEFTAPVFFATAKIDNPDALNRERSEIVVQPGETKDLFFHSKDLNGVTFDELKEGDVVSFEVKQGDKGPSAVNVMRA